MKTVPLTVIATSGISTDFYLEALKSAGFAPARIIDMRRTSGRPLAKTLSALLGKRLVSQIIEKRRRRTYRSRQLDSLYRKIARQGEGWPTALSAIDLAEYCDNVDTIFASGYEDPRFIEFIAGSPENCFLFTGGGRVGRNLLSITGKRFIHIHPGYLPYVRGADCLLWSLLYRQKAGVTAFYMAPELDAGDIIQRAESDLPAFDISLRDYSETDIYNSLRFFYDHHLRAKLLVDLVRNNQGKNLANLNTIPQQEDEGEIFFFMHAQLRDAVINRLFHKREGQ